MGGQPYRRAVVVTYQTALTVSAQPHALTLSAVSSRA